jgi:MFS family permease
MMAETALAEWRRYPMLPIAAAMGYATSVIHVYGLGPYIEPISQEFGWSRTQTTAGLTIATLLQALASIPIGMMVDRFGSRPLGLLGVLVTPAGFALFGAATGSESNWYMLWMLMALTALPVQSTVWSSAVASRFFASRGLALAVGLCGASFAAALFPWLATKLIAAYGWQRAFPLHALIWVAIAFPIIFFFFRGAQDVGKEAKGTASAVSARALGGVGFAEGLRSSIYLRLLLTSLLFTFGVLALVVHFIPIMTDGGMSKTQAAEMAVLIGVFSIVGRIGTGLLLDRFRGSLVGAIALLLPAIGCVVLITSGTSVAGATLAAMVIGLTLGAEIDVIVYLTTRHFGLRNFGALYGGLLIALSVGTAIGPLVASRIFDLYGNYTPFLWLTVVFMVASSLSLLSLPQPVANAGSDDPAKRIYAGAT